MKDKTKISGEISRGEIKDRISSLENTKRDYLVGREVMGIIGIPLPLMYGGLMVGLRMGIMQVTNNPDFQIWSNIMYLPPLTMLGISSYLTFRYLPKKISEINTEIGELEKLARRK